jgi:hypothetical protein
VLAAVALTIVVALVLQSSTPDAGGDREASLSAAQVAVIAKRVESIRQLRFAHLVKPVFLARKEVVRIFSEALEREYPPREQRSDEESLKLLGLMRPSERLGKALAAVGSEQVLGFYDDERKRLVVVRDPTAARPLLEITLAHELVHALEDQRFGFHVRKRASDDSALAESALAEGSATEVMIEYARRYFGAVDALGALASTSGATTKLPPYVEKSLLFPYEAGLRFVEAIRGESGSWRALDGVLRHRRPSSAEQILHPAKYAADERPVRVGLRDLGPSLGRGWQRVGISSVGEFDLRALFEIVGGAPDDAAAAGWGGGRFALWRKDGFRAPACSAPCTGRDVGAMRLAWDSDSDRSVADEAMATALVKGLRAKRIGGAAGITFWSSRGGAIALAGAGRRTSLVFAPEIGLVARLLARLGR